MMRMGPIALSMAGVLVLLSANAWAAPTEPNQLQNPLVVASDCHTCHDFGNPDRHLGEPPHAPSVSWQGSLMANAARDPVFWAAVAIASQDMPGETEACIRCHAPRAFLAGREHTISIDELHDPDFEGITCDLCHRMVEDSEVALGNALYTIDDTLAGETVARRGPWSYDEGVIPPPPHPYLQDEFIGTSAMCGVCHDVTTPRDRVDGDGQFVHAGFNEQRTYSEWLQSDFADPQHSRFASCQDCHMPAVSDMAGCREHVNNFAHPEGGRTHDLVGINRFVLELLQQIYGDQGEGAVASILYDFAMDRTDALLQTAATLEVTAPESVDLTEGLLGLGVTVINNSGHKLPTGYSEGRIAWIEVVARYRDDVVFSSGRWEQSVGTIEQDEQLRTYEALAEDALDGTNFHLLRNNYWRVDSRIPPAGLRPDPQTDPVGDRYQLQEDGTWPHYDVHSYHFAGRSDIVDASPEDPTDDSLDVSIRLLYLVNTPEYIRFLAEANTTNEAGIEVQALFEGAGGAVPLVLAEQHLVLPVTRFGNGASSTSTDGGSETTAATSSVPKESTSATDGDDSTSTASHHDSAASRGGCVCTASRAPQQWWSWVLLGFAGWSWCRRKRACPASWPRL